MSELGGSLALLVVALGLALIGGVRFLLPRPMAEEVLTFVAGLGAGAAGLGAVAAGLGGGYWLVWGNPSDRLAGAVLVAGAVVGLCILANGARPPHNHQTAPDTTRDPV